MIKNICNIKLLYRIIFSIFVLFGSFIEPAKAINFKEYLFLNNISGRVYLNNSLINTNTKIDSYGNEIRSLENSSVNIYIDSLNNSKYDILVRENSIVKIERSTDPQYIGNLYIELGQVRVKVNEEINLRTPSSITSVRGTAFELLVDDEGNSMILVTEGEVINSSIDGRFINRLQQGEGSLINKDDYRLSNTFTIDNYDGALRLYSIKYIFIGDNIYIRIKGYLKRGFYIKRSNGSFTFGDSVDGTFDIVLTNNTLNDTFLKSIDNRYTETFDSIIQIN